MTILPGQQLSSSNSTNTHKKSTPKVADSKAKEPVKPHFKASLEDAQWVTRQNAPVQQLWIECQIAEHFGANDWREVKTTLKDSTFRKAKVVLEDQGLFKFKPIPGVSSKGRMTVAGWLVHNNHGYYNKQYWEVTSLCTEQPCDTQSEVAPQESTLLPTERRCSVQSEVELETLAMTKPGKCQPRINHSSTTHQQPTKVVGEVVSIPQETHQTPLGGAGATDGGMLEEKKDASTHSPASVEDQAEVASVSATNLGGGESSGGGGIATELFSDINYTEFPFTVGDQITINWPNTEHDGKTGIVKELYWEDREVDVQLENVLAIFCFPMARILGSAIAPSTKTRFNPEHAQKRKTRQSQLRCADVLGECPGAEFLAECWQDILLRSQVKALIAKHPEWGLFADSADQLQSWFDS